MTKSRICERVVEASDKRCLHSFYSSVQKTTHVMAARTRTAVMVSAAIISSLFAPYAANAQTYPGKPVTIIVPFTPGGSVDLVARTLAAKLTESLGQTVIVENQGGAGGEVGIGSAIKSRADGHTLLVTPGGPMTAGPHFRKQPFDVVNDLAPVAMVAVIPTVFAVNSSLPVKTLAEFIKYVKERPNSINYSNPGLGSGNHLAAELLKQTAGINMVPVPYKGASAAAVAVASGEVHAGTGDLTSFLPFAANTGGSGKVRILATYGGTRPMAAPDVPTVAEAGVPSFRSIAFIGLFAPAKTPPEIINRLNTEVMRILQRPDVSEILVKAGAEPAAPMTPAAFGRFVREEIDKAGKLIKAANIKTE
jgi:tripartite-type tricarboxylate transporter receptor subunit TctC